MRWCVPIWSGRLSIGLSDEDVSDVLDTGRFWTIVSWPDVFRLFDRPTPHGRGSMFYDDGDGSCVFLLNREGRPRRETFERANFTETHGILLEGVCSDL